MLGLCVLLAAPALLVPYRLPHNAVKPALSAIRMEAEDSLSILDTTPKFDEIAAGAAASGSAAVQLGKE